MQNVVGPILIAMETTFALGAESNRLPACHIADLLSRRRPYRALRTMTSSSRPGHVAFAVSQSQNSLTELPRTPAVAAVDTADVLGQSGADTGRLVLRDWWRTDDTGTVVSISSKISDSVVIVAMVTRNLGNGIVNSSDDVVFCDLAVSRITDVAKYQQPAVTSRLSWRLVALVTASYNDLLLL